MKWLSDTELLVFEMSWSVPVPDGMFVRLTLEERAKSFRRHCAARDYDNADIIGFERREDDKTTRLVATFKDLSAATLFMLHCG